MNRIALAVKSALGVAILVPPSLALAADATPNDNLEEIVVTGIRKSVELSIDLKRNATDLTEVVSAEDIGKMPDKNVADSIARLPGITTSAAGANEGGFDENDRVSMRGTNPSLTQTLINGHSVAAGDWFVLDQVQTVGRSVSYTLLPSEMVSKVVVNKSSSASLVEGGVAGSVNIVTRKPLDFTKPITLEASAGAVYAQLPSKTDPQFSALFNWKNEANNFGILLQGFSETRHLRRDGEEVLGYEQIAPGSPVATAHPDLANVYYPVEIGEAFFTQKRERNGGMIDIEFKPLDNLTLDLSGFASKLLAANYNRNYLMWSTHFINLGNGQSPDPGYVVQNNTLTSANFAAVPGTLYGVYDQISRPDESATAKFVNLDVNWDLNDSWNVFGQVGTSQGDGKTPTQNVSETNPGLGSGAGYQLNGIGTGPNFNLGSTINNTPTPGGVPVTFGWIFGAQNIDVKDKETWAKLDNEFKVNDSAWKDLKFGVRYEQHDRTSNNAIAQGPTFGPNGGGTNPANYPTTYSNYPSNFDTFGGNVPTHIWYWTEAQLAAYNNPANVNRDPVSREYYQFLFQVHEKNSAGYVQADFKGDRWSANAGIRYVHTEEDAVTYTQVDPTTPGAILTSAFGPFAGLEKVHSYNDILPSANLKLDLAPDLLARFAVAETMTRADYSALAGFTNLSPPGGVGGIGSGTGGNPDLKPIRSTNYDAGLEWYFAKSSLLSATAFYMDLRNYVSYGSQLKTYTTFDSTCPTGCPVVYNLSVPVNAKGRVEGLELAYQQAFTDNIGIITNYTYADAKQTSLVTTGDDRLVGASKNTYNVQGYFENNRFSARVAYTYRSSFYSGLDRSSAFTQAAIGTLSASLNLTITDQFSVSLDGMNLNNPILKYYGLNESQPRAFYKNGQQYYLNFRFKL